MAETGGALPEIWRNNQAWHAIEPVEVLRMLHTIEAGLTEPEARARLAVVGPNRLPEEPPTPWWRIAVRQFQNPLIYLLLAAAAMSLGLGHWDDAGFILAVLLINASIGGYQEWKTEQSLSALKRLLQIRATVLRNGESQEIPAELLVPGDVVWLESGNRVPADLRLIWSQGLEVDESLLTGESVSVSKESETVYPIETPLADRRNMVYAGTWVVRGRAKGVVAATGPYTATGQIATELLHITPSETPLLQRMARFAHTVGAITLACTGAIALIGIFLRGYGFVEIFTFAVAVTVSTVPEGLPVAITVALTVAVLRLVKRGAMVRHLAAVEALGSCNLIATDKTGTLTCNQLTVRRVWLLDGSEFEVTGEGYTPHGQITHQGKPLELAPESLQRLVRAGVLCNEAVLHRLPAGQKPQGGKSPEWSWHGDPTDLALLVLGHKLGFVREEILDLFPQIAAIPFEPELRYAATYHRHGASVQVVVKGSPERVSGMCRWASDQQRHRALAQAEELARQGYRVLALAEGMMDSAAWSVNPLPKPMELEFLGYVGMIDPLRPGAREAVAACKSAGITVCMVTGDHPLTALAIARELDLAQEMNQVVTGQQLESLPPEALADYLHRIRVFARMIPKDKLDLVRAAVEAGYFVAVTGDGVNDAPALRAAHIGVAMGQSGTDVAREASDLVLTDDNFATIVAGIEEGRIAYDNIRKVIYLLVSTGAAELFMVLLCFATGLPLPLLPVHFLWLNLVTNGIQHVGLAFDRGESDVLQRKPRPPGEPIFDYVMVVRTVLAATWMGAIGVGLFAWLLQSGWNEASARNVVLLQMVLFENVHIGNCRSETKSAFSLSPLRNPLLLLGTITAFLVHVLAMHAGPLRRILEVEPVPVAMWAVVLLLAVTTLIPIEIHKLWMNRRR